MVREQGSREKLLETAASLFHQKGFQPTGLDEILARSGVCRSNFYYHFRSKEDLGLEVLSRQVEQFQARVIRGVLEDDRITPRSRLERLFEMMRREARDGAFRDGCPFGNLAAELCGSHPEFQARLSAFFQRWEKAFERCLQEGVASGQFRADLNTRGTATAFVSQVEGAVLLTKTHGHAEPVEAAALVMLKLLEGR